MKPVLAAALCAALYPGAAMATDVSGEAGLISDYRYRGISLSDHRPALQASLTLEHDSGFYLNAWASTVDGPLGRFRTEVDFTGGYEKEVVPGIGIDLSSTLYLYPADTEPNYVELTAAALASRGNGSAKLGFSFVPRQAGTDHHWNRYMFGELSYDLPKSPLSLTARLGRENGWFDEVEHGSKWDWSLGVEADFAPARVGIAYTGSNAPSEKAALVGSVFLAF